jgi:hypothetical protein
MNQQFRQKVSYFRNVYDRNPWTIPLDYAIRLIRSDPKLAKLCSSLRNLGSDEERTAFKIKYFPAITVSGTFFNGHGSLNLIQHSGLVQIDFDAKDFPPIVNLEMVKGLVQGDPLTYVGFESCSGGGYKAIAKIDPDPVTHASSIEALQKRYHLQGLKIDTSCVDLGRLCFLSSDPRIYFNPFAKSLPSILAAPGPNGNRVQEATERGLENQVLGIIIQIEKFRVDITDAYKDWLKIGFALADEFGERGRLFFHRISSISEKYNQAQANRQFTECLKARKTGVTIRSFFLLAQRHGININPQYLIQISKSGFQIS